MTKCHLGHKNTWPTKERSEGPALSLGFLSEYSAAVHVDVIHPLSLTAVQDDPEPDFKKKKATVARPKPQVVEFVKLRAPIRNLVSPIGHWNLTLSLIHI